MAKEHNGKHSKKNVAISVKKVIIFIVFLLAVVFCMNIKNIIAYYTDKDSVSNEFSIEAEYIITYDSNTGTGSMEDQVISYNIATNLTSNTFIKEGYVFLCWNTKQDGSGTEYIDGQEVENIGNVTLYAQWGLENVVAEINGEYYTSIQEAVNTVKTNNIEVTIKLLVSTSEYVKTVAKQNIVLDLQNHTLSDTGKCIIDNYGTLKIYNGTLKCSTTKEGAINNKSTGKLTITGGQFITDKKDAKQVIYNDKGKVFIEGGYFQNISTVRSTIQNLSGGTLTITGGTIVADGNKPAITNEGTMTIGIKDGDINKNSPIIKSTTYGISSTTNYNFYNGIIKGKTCAVDDYTKVVDTEDGYDVVSDEEEIDGEIYRTLFLGIRGYTVTFDPNEGTVIETARHIEAGKPVGNLPIPTKTDYIFIGWFTLPKDGEMITSDIVFNEDIVVYAQWESSYVAEINGVKYNSLSSAIKVVPTENVETTVKLLKNISEHIVIPSNKTIILDLQGFTLSSRVDDAVITNNGTLTITNGIVTSVIETGTINNNTNGFLRINGATIIGIHRSAIYNSGGTVEILDGYLVSDASGVPTASTLERGTVFNLNGGTVIITGGTIIGNAKQAISNDRSTLIIGTAGDGINTSSPEIRGKTCGISNIGTLKYYDGIIKGITGTIEGTITEKEENTSIVEGSEVIDDETYITNYLQND